MKVGRGFITCQCKIFFDIFMTINAIRYINLN